MTEVLVNNIEENLTLRSKRMNNYVRLKILKENVFLHNKGN